MPNLNKVLMAMMYTHQRLSIPQIAEAFNRSKSGIRYHLIRCGVKLRTAAEGMCLRRDVIADKLRGIKRGPFSKSHRDSIRSARLKHGEQFAKTVGPHRGYLRYTRGPHKGKYVHKVIMEARIGRKMNRSECVHHKDENKTNNSPENLVLMTLSEHARYHRIQDAKS